MGCITILTAPHVAARPQVGVGDDEAAEESADPTAGVEVAESPWFDAEDGFFDVSPFLAHPAGFLPIVVPITEPALGYGAVAAVTFLQPRERAGAEGWSRPNITAVGGMWTEGGSEGGFAMDSRLWGDGGFQTLFGGAALSLDLDYYGAGPDSIFDDSPLEYVLDVWGLLSEGRLRFGESDFWGALRFAYAETDVKLRDAPPMIPGIEPKDLSSTLAGPAVALRYDSLDNLFTPTRGTLAEASGSFFDDAFGGDRDFQILDLTLIHHLPLAERWFLGGRAQFGAAFGDTPFYARPYVQQRGIPALRYQGDEALSSELELRWQFHPRFSVVGFGGGGFAWLDEGEGEERGAFAGGGGVRYVIARRFGLHMGLDYAYSLDGGAIYVQVGNAWLRF